MTLVDPSSASQADFQLSGSISMEGIQGGARYTIDLHLTGKDGDTVWVGGLERDITCPSAREPAESAPPAAASPGSRRPRRAPLSRTCGFGLNLSSTISSPSDPPSPRAFLGFLR